MCRHSQRGQVFPVWTFGTLTMLSLLAFSVNYGNSLYWQLRAQNAADAAAQGAISIQATHWNALLSDLHAASVEEYRIRYLLRDLAMVSSTNGQADTGCSKTALDSTGCAAMYGNLRSQFLAATNRYTADVQMIQTLDAPQTGDDKTAIAAAIANFQSGCATSDGGDCGFSYTVINQQQRTANLENVISDCCGSTIGGGLTSPAGLNGNLLPLKIEVIACANVNPLFPTALSWIKAPVYQAVGRAAATTLMATQEYMEVGGVINPKTGQPFQPAEFPESTSNAPVFTSNNDANLRIEFGGNINKPYNNNGNPQNSTPAGQFMGTIGNQLMDVYTGWWTSIAVPPYSGTVSSSSYTCK